MIAEASHDLVDDVLRRVPGVSVVDGSDTSHVRFVLEPLLDHPDPFEAREVSVPASLWLAGRSAPQQVGVSVGRLLHDQALDHDRGSRMTA